MAEPTWEGTTPLDARSPAQGVSVPTWDDTFSIEEKYSGALPALKAFGLGAARSTSFGLSDQALVQSGLMTPEELKAYKEQQEIASIAGEVGGVLGSFALPGVGVLGAVSAPVKGVAKLGSTAAKAILPTAEATTTAGKILSQAGTLGLGSAIEGAVYGLGQSVSEHALGDPELNAEKVGSNVINGFLFGGGLGVALGAASHAIPASVNAAKGAFTKLYDVAVGLPSKDVGILGKAYAQTSSFVSGKGYDQIIEGLKERSRSLIKPEEQREAIESFSQGLKDQHDKVSRALSDANKNARVQETAQYLKEIPADAALPEMTKAVSRMKTAIQDMRAEPDLYPGAYPRILEQITERASKEVGAESKAFDVFKSLDDLKGRLDEEISYGAAPSGGDLRAQTKIGEIRRFIKNSLEDSAIWGEAASRQAQFNDAQSMYFNLTGKKGLFRQSFMGQALGKGGKLIYEVSPAKVETYLKQINSTRGEAKSEALKKYLEISDNLVNQIEKTYQTLPDKAFNKDSLRSVIGKSKELSQKAIEQAEFNKTMNALGAGAHNVPLAEGAALGTTIVGHPIIGAALETVGMLKAPGLAAQRLAKVERLVQETDRVVSRAVSSIFKTGVKAIKPITGYGGTKISPEDKEKKYNKVTSQINELGNDPQKLMSSLEGATSNLYEHAPRISQSLQMTMARATQFLQSKMPGNNVPLKPLSAPYLPSDMELSKWQKYYAIVEDPTLALNQVATGTLVPETMETLSAVYPKLLNAMQAQVTEGLVDMVAKKRTVPYGTKMMLSMFLGQDLVSSLDPKSMLATQNIMSTATQSKQMQESQMSGANRKDVGKMNSSNRLLTASQKSAERTES